MSSMDPWQPQPAQPKSKSKGCLVFLAVAAVLLVLCGGGAFFGLRWWYAQELAKLEQEKAADPTNPLYIEVGQCLVPSPTPEFPDNMVIGPCSTPGSYTVLKRYSGDNVRPSDCTEGTDTYEVTDPDKDAHYVICMNEN